MAQSIYNSKKVVLIEAGDLFVKPTKIGNRVSSLTPTSVNLLRELGAWDLIERKWDYDSMTVWDSCSDGRIGFDGAPVATIVENQWIQYSLASLLKDQELVSVLNKERVKDIQQTDRPVVQLESGVEIECEVLVGADGPNSKVRSFGGIDTVGMEYGQSGLVATVEVQESENSTAWQRFLPMGPVALLPLSRTKSSIVWTLDTKVVQKVCALGPSAFVELLNAALHNPYQDVLFLLNQIDPNGHPKVDFGKEAEWGRTRGMKSIHPPWVVDVESESRQAFPLRTRHANSYIGDRTVLIGDAAHTIHPLAGQGLNLGLADAESLARAMSEGMKTGQDLGHVHLLEQYEKDRYRANAAMLMACDAINRLFSQKDTIFMPLRSLGLNTLDKLDHMKKLIMHVAS